MKHSLQSQISAVRREAAVRRHVYGRAVAARKMRQAEADIGIEQMEAVQRTLEWLLKNEEAVRARVVASGGEDLS